MSDKQKGTPQPSTTSNPSGGVQKSSNGGVFTNDNKTTSTGPKSPQNSK